MAQFYPWRNQRVECEWIRDSSLHLRAKGEVVPPPVQIQPCWGCMHRRVFIKKTWLSAFSYAQSHISLVFCCSLGFLVPLFSPLQLNRVGGFFVLCMEKKVGGLYFFVCKNYISLTCLNGFFAIFNFDNILIKSNIFIWSLFQHANNSKTTKQLLGF